MSNEGLFNDFLSLALVSLFVCFEGGLEVMDDRVRSERNRGVKVV